MTDLLGTTTAEVARNMNPDVPTRHTRIGAVPINETGIDVLDEALGGVLGQLTKTRKELEDMGKFTERIGVVDAVASAAVALYRGAPGATLQDLSCACEAFIEETS